MSEEKKKGTAPARAGHRRAKIAVYYLRRYPFNKLKKILRHNGLAAARVWAKEHMEDAALIRAKKAVKESNWAVR